MLKKSWQWLSTRQKSLATDRDGGGPKKPGGGAFFAPPPVFSALAWSLETPSIANRRQVWVWTLWKPRKCSDATDCVPHDQDNHRTDHCDQQAVEIETGHSHVPEL